MMIIHLGWVFDLLFWALPKYQLASCRECVCMEFLGEGGPWRDIACNSKCCYVEGNVMGTYIYTRTLFLFTLEDQIKIEAS